MNESNDINKVIIAHWNFDEIQGKNRVLEIISQKHHDISGHVKYLEGTNGGKCLRLDGYTTHITILHGRILNFHEKFTLSTRIGLGSYPYAVLEEGNENFNC